MMKSILTGFVIVGAALVSADAAMAQVSIGISVNLAPPPLPVYVQPPLPGPDFIWTPGYWAWDDDEDGYFWVPGSWVRAPRPGLLWTPPWWGWTDGAYAFHTGYWGPTVGFYGGVPYGFGYTGFGFQGGFWRGGHVSYNSAVTNVTSVTNVTNIYHTTVNENNRTRVSYNGGPGGVQARPTPEELSAERQPHIAPGASQETHLAAARSDPRSFARANHGRPPVPATQLARALPRPVGGRPSSGTVAIERGGRPGPDAPPMADDRAMSSDVAYPRAGQRQRDGFEQSYAAPRQAPPLHSGRPHNPPPPHHAPQPHPPRPHPQAQPHPPKNAGHPQHGERR